MLIFIIAIDKVLVPGASDLIHYSIMSWQGGFQPSLQKTTNFSEISPLFKLWMQTTKSEWTLSSWEVENSLFWGFGCSVCRQNCCFPEGGLMVLWFTRSSSGTMTTSNSAVPVNFISSARPIFYNSHGGFLGGLLSFGVFFSGTVSLWTVPKTWMQVVVVPAQTEERTQH